MPLQPFRRRRQIWGHDDALLPNGSTLSITVDQHLRYNTLSGGNAPQEAYYEESRKMDRDME